MKILKDNGFSKVWVNEEINPQWIYKQQPKFLTDNEIWCLEKLYHTGYVPFAQQIELEVIKLEFIKSEPVTDSEAFLNHVHLVLDMLNEQGIRHGDLSRYSVLVKDNKPVLIDFAESRLACDPRVDKRQDGDDYWLTQTMRGLCSE